jgi:hypothetical protein
VATEIAVFPWNHILLDGQEVPPDQLRAWKPDKLAPWNGAYQIVVPVPAGVHWLEHRFVPDPTWHFLHRAAWVVLLGWMGVFAAWMLTQSLLKRRLKTDLQHFSIRSDSYGFRLATLRRSDARNDVAMKHR